MHAPSLADPAIRQSLAERSAPYWNILEYCRHIGIEKRQKRPTYWLARVRKSDGGYMQAQLAVASGDGSGGIEYEAALELAREWFARSDVAAVASKSYPVGSTQELRYAKVEAGFTVGDALVDFVEWKRIAATPKTYESLLSLINFHLVPRLGQVRLEDMTGRIITEFCRDILEVPPKRGNQTLGPRTAIADLEADALRRRKSTLNTLLGILRVATRMAWENGNTDSERAWRCIRRVPNRAVPRQIFLTRPQCRALLRACRSDLADLVRGALYSGCRVSELAALRVCDVGKDVFGLYIASPKHYRPRYIYLPEEGMRFFLGICAGKADDDHVFRTQAGQIWRGRHKHLFREAVERAGLPDGFVFHGLRHTYASQLVQAGTPLAMIARQLGHANTDTVSRTYGHLSCASIEQELALRFASIEPQSLEHDPKMRAIRNSLQGDEPDLRPESWPRSNFSGATGLLVRELKSR